MELELRQLDRRYEALRRRSPRRERRLLASLAQHGQQQPIIVVGSEGSDAIVDGFKRVRALSMLRRDVVVATRWELPEPDALVLDWQLREGGGSDALEQAWLLRELRERFDLAEEELARRCDRSKSWVSRRLALVSELPEEIQETVRRDELGAHAAMKYLVPLARQPRRMSRADEGVGGAETDQPAGGRPVRGGAVEQRGRAGARPARSVALSAGAGRGEPGEEPGPDAGAGAARRPR